MKKFVFKSLALVTVFTVVSCSNDFDDMGMTKPEAPISELQAIELGTNLIESFKASPLRSSSDIIYPNYYCGTYINDEKELVVLVNENSLEIQKNLESRVQGTNFVVRNATFSMTDLEETISVLNEFFFEEANKNLISEVGLDGFGIIPSENVVFVRLKDCSDSKINDFKNKVLNSPMLKFVQSEGDVVAEETLVPGAAIKATSTGSFGYRARLNGKNGFVTSGHVARTVGGTVYKDFDIPSSSEAIGICKASTIGGSVDAAFVELTGGYTAGNVTSLNTTISSTVEYPFQGASVYKEGKNGLGVGSINAVNVTQTITIPSTGQKVTLWGIVEATYGSSGGDSGAVVYSGSYNIYGIHEGSGNGFAYFITATNINSSLGLTTF